MTSYLSDLQIFASWQIPKITALRSIGTPQFPIQTTAQECQSRQDMFEAKQFLAKPIETTSQHKEN